MPKIGPVAFLLNGVCKDIALADQEDSNFLQELLTAKQTLIDVDQIVVVPVGTEYYGVGTTVVDGVWTPPEVPEDGTSVPPTE